MEAESNSASTIKKQTVKEHTRKKTDVIIEQYDNDNNNSNKNVSSPSPNKAFPNCDDGDGVTESDRKDDKTRYMITYM